ncbi:hypothetical protein T440DRAFT_488401 [Plenodomus tracheiphilus IPT5]|uniref:Uncharacterized protein n=1 Tax=Plenodomus tracheiphilus IPT5 TaxID=1408161 RepID=A0A6A7BAE2_9PLEO|nr:hypothetical protein T440DRAFT_488401 [Plenodomus tracheiphilus IPT5]
MFIDASNGGVNAKPDKLVRSFVMKSARNKKPWSTKPKSPVSEKLVQGRAPRRPPSRPDDRKKTVQLCGCSPHAECNTCPSSQDQSVVSSPDSRSVSVVSSRNSDRAYESSLSSYASPHAEYDDTSFPCDTVRRLSAKYQCNSNIGFSASFDCLAVRLDAYAEGLIHQFVQFATPCLLPIDPHQSSKAVATRWIATCIQSPIGAPFIYAALTTSMRAAQLDSEVYKWRAVSAVNKLLTNHKYSTEDITITAVLILLALEESVLADPQKKGEDRTSSVRANNAHLSGLRAMVEQRGGLVALDGNRCLQVCILMHSIAQSIATFKRPYAVLHDVSGHVEESSATLSKSSNRIDHITRQCHDLGVSHVLLSIIRTIVLFAEDLTVWYDAGVCSMDSLDLQKHASMLMYRLFDWYDRCPQDDMYAIGQTICLALLIFMTHATEPNSASFGSRLSKAVTKLRSSLQKIPLSQWSNASNLYLWTLTMGLLGAHDPFRTSTSFKTDQLSHFFAQKIALACGTASLDPTAVTHLLSKLQSCPWIPSVFAERVKVLLTILNIFLRNDPDNLVTATEGGDCLGDNVYALGQSTTMRFFTKSKSCGANDTPT